MRKKATSGPRGAGRGASGRAGGESCEKVVTFVQIFRVKVLRTRSKNQKVRQALTFSTNKKIAECYR